MDGMTVLKEIRRRVGGVEGILDSINIDYSDEFWFEYVDGAVNFLSATDIITATYLVSGTVISPEPSTIDGLLLANWTVWTYLASDLSKKVRSGELGIRFKTGQDEISTVEAARKIETIADQAEKSFRHLVGMKLADKDGKAVRVQ